MKPFQLFILGTLIIFLAWGSLFITTLDQIGRLNKLAVQTQQLAQQNKQLSIQNKNLLTQIQQGNNSIHSQINCVLNFFSQNPTTRTNSSISNPNQCIITPDGSSGGATSIPKVTSLPQSANNGTVSPQPTTNGKVAPQTSPAPTYPPAVTPPPKKPLVLQLLEGLL